MLIGHNLQLNVTARGNSCMVHSCTLLGIDIRQWGDASISPQSSRVIVTLKDLDSLTYALYLMHRPCVCDSLMQGMMYEFVMQDVVPRVQHNTLHHYSVFTPVDTTAHVM